MTYGPKTKLAAFDWWQKRGTVHPLTCGNDDAHDYQVDLISGVTSEGNVYLECPDCGWVQGWDHDYVVEYWRHLMVLGVAYFSTEAGTYTVGGGQDGT